MDDFSNQFNKAVDEVSRATNWISRWCNAGGELIAKTFVKDYEEASEPKMARLSADILNDVIDGFRKGGMMMMTERGTGRKVPMPALSEVNIAKMLEGESGGHLLNMVHKRVYRDCETHYLKAIRTRDAKIKELEIEYYKSNPAPADYNPVPKVETSTDPLLEIERREREMSKYPAAKKAKRK